MIELTKNKKHIIIKRDGREEEYNEEKLKKVINWATDNKKVYTDSILQDLQIKINNKMKITVLYDNVINTVVNKISTLYSIYDDIAKKLYLLKLYKETANLKKIGEYPDLYSIIKLGIKKEIYSKEILKDFTKEEINVLNTYIKPNRDLLFTYSGLYIFNKKYCKGIGNEKLELPQITYMIASMYSFCKDKTNKRLKYIKELYNMVSKHEVTFATPRICNSYTRNNQLASCVLNTVDDDTWSINETDNNIAMYSRSSGGIGYDMSFIRATGSKISSTRGFSDGPVPFIKRIEQTISSFNQGGVRKGSAVITFSWWHWDVQDLVMLKDAGGTEDTRARKLVYAVKINNLFRKRVDNDDYITLFDPKETRILNECYGSEFEKNYLYFENKKGIRKKKIKAKDLLFQILKIRQETGNLYLTFIDNINEQSIINEFVGSSNLCQEIVIPSSPSKLISEEIKTENGKTVIITKKESGEIGICNLCSINLSKWVTFTESYKNKMIYVLLRSCDNILDTQYYPVAEGEVSNKRNRPIGIGVFNYANMLALNKYKYTDLKSLHFINSVFDNLYYTIYYQSMQLAKERGSYSTFDNSKWKDGYTPLDLSLFNEKEFGIKTDWDKWNKLGNLIEKYGVRFSFHSAIAPTACQTLDTEIRYKNKSMIFEDYLKKNGIKVLDIMFKGKQGWFEFTNPDTIDTRYGEKEVHRVWYNGKYEKTISLYFENDDKPYTFTQNHKLLSINNEWKQVKDFKIGDFVVDETQSNKRRKIVKIKTNFDIRDTWDLEVPDVHEYLLGNGVVTHNTSGKSVNSTESIEPIVDLFYTNEGTQTLPSLVPNLKECRQYYERCWTIPAKIILLHAAIRQRYIDQSQSLNLYYIKPESAKELWEDIKFAMDLGIKTLYYMKTPKSNFELEEHCDSCT